MSPATQHARARGARERRHPRPVALAPGRERAHRLCRGRPRRRSVPARGRARPRPRRLLPPLRLRGLRRNEHVPHHAQQSQPRGPHGSLERRPLEDGDVRLARLRPRRLRPWRHGRHEEHRPEHGRAGRVRPHGQDPRRRLQAAGRRERPDPEPLRSRRHDPPSTRRSRTSSRASRRWRPSRTSARRSTPATRTRSRRTARPRSSSSTIRGDKDEAVDKIGPVLDAVAAAQARPSGLLIGEFGDASAREAVDTAYDGRPRQGGYALAPDHADRPRAHVRRARGSGHPAAARAHRRLRDLRAVALRVISCRWRCRRRRWCS